MSSLRLFPVDKRCSACAEVKPLEAFYVRRASSDGRHPLCIPCAKVVRRRRYDARLARAGRERQKLITVVQLDGQPAKECRTCGVVKLLTDFYPRAKKSLGGCQAECKECRKRAVRSYGAANRGKVREGNRRRYAKQRQTPELRAAERQRLRVFRNSEKGKAQQRAYYQRNRATVIARSAAWVEANRERARESQLRNTRKRRALLRAATVAHITADQLAGKVAYWGWRCWICQGEWDQIDHVKPVAKGGPHVLSNQRPICGTCNRRKQARWPFPTTPKAAREVFAAA